MLSSELEILSTVCAEGEGDRSGRDSEHLGRTEPFSDEVGCWRPLFVSKRQSHVVKYLRPTEFLSRQDKTAYFDLVLQFSTLPMCFLAGTALEMLILTHSSHL